jgi:hypothetical protein
MTARGQEVAFGERRGVVTIHPSAVLRADEEVERLRALLVEDLRLARRLAE